MPRNGYNCLLFHWLIFWFSSSDWFGIESCKVSFQLFLTHLSHNAFINCFCSCTFQTPEVDSSLSIQRSNSTTKTKGRQKSSKGQPTTFTEKKSPAKQCRKDQEMEGSGDVNDLPKCDRTMSESQELTSPERGILFYITHLRHIAHLFNPTRMFLNVKCF